eukprot:11355698-Alexandrium_andersonii.AAC.1
MSASLVGSEMCIRDSRPPRPPEKRLRRAHRPASSADPVSARNMAHNPPPVSYTHLTLPTICSV